jgi:formate hydrogenlyase subunit 3/multisubunit Na+/H+ antiporter MnhD subunit
MSAGDALRDAPWTVLVILVPLMAAGAASLGRRRARLPAFCAAFALPPMTALLAWQVAAGGPRRTAVGGWGAPLGITLYADGLAAALLAVTALVGCLVTLYASAYFHDPSSKTGGSAPFWPLWMFLWSALNALFLSADIFNLYVTLELTGLSAVALTALARSAPAVSAALRYLFVSLTGSLAYLMGVALLYSATGTLSAGMLGGRLGPGPAAAAFALMSAGLALKTALFPLHFWLPPAHASAPAPVSAVLSGLVVKSTFYILLRLWFGLFPPGLAAAAAFLPGLLGAGAVLWGSIQALRAERLKLLVAYSTVAQIGYLFLVLPLGQAAGQAGAAVGAGIALILAHACAKSAAFLAAGNVLTAFGHDRIGELGGIVRQLPISMFAFATAGVSLIGLPPTGGFVAKWLLLKTALASGRWDLAAVVLGGGLLATATIFRVFSRAFRYVPPEELCTPACAPVSRRREWAALALALAAMGLGFAAVPLLGLLAAGMPPAGIGWPGGAP